MEKIEKSRNRLHLAISVLVAIVLWIFVTYQETTVSTRWLRDIPITIVGADILDQNGYYIVETDRKTVDVKLEGDRVDLSKVVKSDVTARLDVSAVEAAGSTSLTCDITVDKKNIDVSGARHNSVSVTAEKITTDLFPVSIDITGTPAVGYNVFEPGVYPAEVTVRGAESIVGAIASVSTKSVNVSKVSRSNTVNVGLTAFDKNGRALSGVTFDPASVEVSYTVLREKSVTLNVPLTGAPAGKKVTYEPQSVKIYGTTELLANIAEIKTESVDISQIGDGDKLIVGFALPYGVYSSEEGENVELTFSIEDAVSSASNSVGSGEEAGEANDENSAADTAPANVEKEE